MALNTLNSGEEVKASELNDNFDLLWNFIRRKFGDGSDGSLDTSDGAVDIDFDENQVIEKQYDSINIDTNDLTFSNPNQNGSIAIIRCTGDATISSTIDISKMGAEGGYGDSDSDNPDEPGYDGIGLNIYGAKRGDNGAGTLPETPITTFISSSEYFIDGRSVVAGGGGGAGANGSDYSGPGGRGGGGLVLFIRGTLDFSGTIDASGGDGGDGIDNLDTIEKTWHGGNGGCTAQGIGQKGTSDEHEPFGSDNKHSSGGGGGGGHIVIEYRDISTDTGTIDVSGGAGGAADYGKGGDGADGYYIKTNVSL